MKDASRKYQVSLQRYEILLELFKPNPCLETLEELLVDPEGRCVLLDIVKPVFCMGQHGVALSIINGLFASSYQQRTHPTPEDVADRLQAALTQLLVTVDAKTQKTCITLAIILNTMFISLNRTFESLNISESCLAKLPAELRYQLLDFRAIRPGEGRSYEEVMNYHD